MKVKRSALFAAIVFAVLGASLIEAGGVSTTARLSSQAKPTPSPRYLPPVCQGKPITVKPRAVALAETPTEIKANPPIAKSDQLKLFDTLTKIITDVYVYPDFNGLNWPSIIAEFRARVVSGLDTEAFYDELQKFVLKLGDQHSYFESPAKAPEKLSWRGRSYLPRKRCGLMAVPSRARMISGRLLSIS